MEKRYRLIVNGEWLVSSNDYAEINEWANRMWEGDNYYGNFPDVRILDMAEEDNQRTE